MRTSHSALLMPRAATSRPYETYYSSHPAASFAAQVWTNNAQAAESNSDRKRNGKESGKVGLAGKG
ncbi:hypothetical protein PUR49_11405, partial [Streptomyces sp. BE147]|nr:hypothetical protein [Streptomyces sp. BE147]